MRRIVLAFLPLAACNWLESGGNSREGRFYAELPGALVEKTSYDLRIYDYEIERSKAAPVSTVTSSDESIAAVTLGEDGVISLEAKKGGSFTLDFTAEADGDELIDAFEVKVIQASRVVLDHFCEASYVANEPADVRFAFSDAAHVQGQGYGWYPVVVQGATLDEAASTARTLRIQLGSETAIVTSSLAPANESPEELVLDVMPRSAISRVAIVDAGHSEIINGRRLSEGDELGIRVVPATALGNFCGTRVASEVTVSEDSDCMLSSTFGSGDLTRTLATNGELIVVVAVSYGICQLTATLVEEGFEQVLDFDLTKPARSGSSDFD